MDRVLAILDQLACRLWKAGTRSRPRPGNRRYIDGVSAQRASDECGAVYLPEMKMPLITDLTAEAVTVVGLLRDAFRGEGQICLDCSPCPGEVSLDSESLCRILHKLIANSVAAARLAHMPVRMSRIEVAVRPPLADAFLLRHVRLGSGMDSVMLSVRDNGPGIPSHVLPCLFDAGFDRGKPTTMNRDEPECSSLFASHRLPKGRGLLVVQRIVERAGGAIRVMSAVGVGTQIDIEMPVRPFPPSIHLSGSDQQRPLGHDKFLNWTPGDRK